MDSTLSLTLSTKKEKEGRKEEEEEKGHTNYAASAPLFGGLINFGCASIARSIFFFLFIYLFAIFSLSLLPAHPVT